MKPILLEMQAFGPFRAAQTIDFERLTRAGLFLITGDTGAGKSTILDAITFALYDESSGNERGRFEEMRCLQSPSGEPSFVKFTFAADGRVYRFERSREYRRRNFVDRYAALVRNPEGAFEPIFENPKKELLRKRAEALTGMSAEQFRQVVILPQGKFEAFLVGSSKDKEEILEKLFGVDRWNAYANKFYELAKARKDAKDAEKRRIDDALRREDCADTDALAEKIARLEKEIADAKVRFESSDHAAREKTVEAQKRLTDRFAELSRAEGEARHLEERRQEIDALEVRQANAKRAENLRMPLKDCGRARAEKIRSEKNAETARQRSAAEAEHFASAQQRAAELNQRKPEREAANAREIVLESKREIYSRIDALRSAAAEAGSAVSAGEKNRERCARALEAGKKRLEAAYAAWQSAREAHDEALRRYMRGISGVLAEKLIENEPCPVCGSTHHPSPARRGEDHIDEAQLREFKKREDQAEADWKRENEAVKRKDADFQAAQKDYEARVQRCAEAEANYRKTHADLAEGIADTAALEREIARVRTDIENFDRLLERAEEALKRAGNQKTAAETDAKRADQARADAHAALVAAEERLADQLAAHGFRTAAEAEAALMEVEALTRITAEIAGYHTRKSKNEESLAALRAELNGVSKPDPKEIAETERALKAENDAYQNAMGAKNSDLRRLIHLWRELEAETRAYERAAPQIATDFEFAKKVKGETGMGLKRYVLSIHFDSVIAAANRMLQSVHNGRYTLYRSDENGDRRTKTGLDLRLHDRYAPENADTRGVRTLSGGEKFLVSLALSIGLSANARSKGLRIDALFIDEGFGTLDESSIEDALEVLGEVRRGSGVVGVISHVKLLEDSVPAKLLVQKGRGAEGSRVIESVG